ncbi:MAG: hypothetical protein JNL13_14915 [Chitinophagaceae bacterium]|nr:hypothetical protein [Chitinophagaceae bacterium]
MKHVQIILYVREQALARQFYEQLFRRPADLDVPGMTEFALSASCKLGLMPNKGIAKILGDRMPHPDEGMGIPRCELYLLVDDAAEEYRHALSIGAKQISPLQDRDWGDKACYFADPDGHVIAFAEKMD